MGLLGAGDKWNKAVVAQVVGTAGTKTYLGQSSYSVFQGFRERSIQIVNVGFQNVGALGTDSVGSLIAGVIEVSNDNSHWGTLTNISGGSLSTASSCFWNGTCAWGYVRVSIAYSALPGLLL